MITAPRGYVKGESVDDIMARTAYLLDHNLIPEALKELDNVTGMHVYYRNRCTLLVCIYIYVYI
jgi:hypothetical protein